MSAPHRSLNRHLVIAIAMKLLALAGLWWFLVRDHAVDAGTEQTAAHLLPPMPSNAPSSGTPK